MTLKNVNGRRWLVACFMLILTGMSAEAAVRKISQQLPVAANTAGAAYTPDGRWITYRADIDVDNRFEMYVIDRENDFLNQKVNVGDAAGAIRWVRLFDDLILYSVGLQTNNRLFASTLPLTAPVELTPYAGGITSWLLFDAQVNASRTTVVFRANQRINGTSVSGRLYSVPLAGGAITLMNAPLDSSFQSVTSFTFLNDQEVIYQTWTMNGSAKLYRASLDGSSAVQISLPADEDSDVFEYEISSSGDYVVYRGDLLTNEQAEVFATHLPTGQIERISRGMSLEEDVIQFDLFDDADRVVYEVGNSFVAAPFMRTRSLDVNDELFLDGNPEFRNVSLTNAATGRVIYTSFSGSFFDHRSSPVSGGMELSLAFPYTGTIRVQIISPQSGFVAMGFSRITDRRELFINRTNGSGLRQLSLGDNSVEFAPEFTVDDAALVFSQVDGNTHELIFYDTVSQRLQVLDRVDQFGQRILFTRPSPVDPDEVVYVKNEQTLFQQNEIWLTSLSQVFSDGFE